jgi:hypothetical protein
MIKAFIAATAISLLSSGAANAATVSQSTTPTAAFDSIVATSAIGAYAANVSEPGLVSGVRRSPWEGTSLDGSVYSAITGSATFALSSLQTAISFVWGSPDGYNSIAFLKDGVAFDFITGSSVTGCCGGNVANSQVTVTASSAFNSFEMRSSQAAFEYANLQVAAVPLPAGGLLLIGAMGGLAALRRRKAAAAA